MKGTVYCLAHVPTGRFYIGSTIQEPERRADNWMGRLCRARANSPSHQWFYASGLSKAFFTFPWEPRDWLFIRLRELPDVTVGELNAAEEAEITRARAVAADRCLNIHRTVPSRGRLSDNRRPADPRYRPRAKTSLRANKPT